MAEEAISNRLGLSGHGFRRHGVPPAWWTEPSTVLWAALGGSTDDLLRRPPRAARPLGAGPDLCRARANSGRPPAPMTNVPHRTLHRASGEMHKKTPKDKKNKMVKKTKKNEKDMKKTKKKKRKNNDNNQNKKKKKRNQIQMKKEKQTNNELGHQSNNKWKTNEHDEDDSTGQNCSMRRWVNPKVKVGGNTPGSGRKSPKTCEGATNRRRQQ